ncbi:uncharacterized protein LOC110986588 [Acanthaster planci]|uniref:Uncharacterized protein LOC110986588 n=1 Tax=Acanthaster planci TaxID=133434 RepID=A0A8B7ZHA1_ACAPL|nr:uncharacterized protein LOC110986588 [Acanthaster planci]
MDKLRPKPARVKLPERPATFAEFGLDMKPYFTLYKDHDRPATFAHFGVDVERERPLVDTVVGPYRKWFNINRREKVFLVTGTVSLLVTLGLTIDRLVASDKATPYFTFALLLVVNIVFCLFYMFHAILLEHPHELFVFAFSIAALFIYCIANFVETLEDGLDIVKLVRLIVMCVFGTFNMVYGMYLGTMYHRQRNLIFRTVGANINLQALCGNMYLFSDLLKFNIQLETSMVILVLDDGIYLNTNMEKIVLGLGLPVTLIWNILGFLAIRYENKLLVGLFLLTCWVLPVYTTYKFVDVSFLWKTWTEHSQKVLPSCILVCGILGILVRVFLVVVVVHLSQNFGHGLGGKVFGAKKLSRPGLRLRGLERRPMSWPRARAFPNKRWTLSWYKHQREKHRRANRSATLTGLS